MVVNLDSQTLFFYNNSYELKQDNIISQGFGIEYADIGFSSFTRDLLQIYDERFLIENIKG